MVVVAGAQPGQLDLAEAAGLPSGDVLARLRSGAAGLSSAEAVQRLGWYGPNALGTHRSARQQFCSARSATRS
jgi:Cation transporter/ATPase, N-terminus